MLKRAPLKYGVHNSKHGEQGTVQPVWFRDGNRLYHGWELVDATHHAGYHPPAPENLATTRDESSQCSRPAAERQQGSCISYYPDVGMFL
jgi:hypothetical protein